MKQLIATIMFCIMIAVAIYSCVKFSSHAGIAKVNYSIVYPDTTITKDSTFYFRYSNDRRIPHTDSYRGTNYIVIGHRKFEHTTCPIRINSYEIIK